MATSALAAGAAWVALRAAGALLGRRRGHEAAGGEATADLVFTGTGTSCGVPMVRCLTNRHDADRARWPPCRVCEDAARPGSLNRRRNTGCVVRLRASGRTIVIDVGKFWYHSALELFPRLGVRGLDAVLLTHEHADAVFGLDDLRDWSVLQPDSPLPVFCAGSTLAKLERSFPYLCCPSKATGSGFVPQLDFRTFCGRGEADFVAAGVRVRPLPVHHGPDPEYFCYGFLFGDVAWISDVSAVPDATMETLRNGGRRLELLVVDALRPRRPHVSHFSLPQAVELARELRPRRTLLVGANHEVDHHAENARLRREVPDLDIQFAHDGLEVPLCSVREEEEE